MDHFLQNIAFEFKFEYFFKDSHYLDWLTPNY